MKRRKLTSHIDKILEYRDKSILDNSINKINWNKRPIVHGNVIIERG